MNETYLFIYFKGFFFPRAPRGVGMWVRKRGRSPPRLRGHPAGALPAPRFSRPLCQAGSPGRLPAGMGMDLRAPLPRAFVGIKAVAPRVAASAL